MPPTLRLAADIGGTFTDIVLMDGERRFATKVLTTPRAPEEAVVAGTRALLGRIDRSFADLALFVHGTTLATNAIIERKGALTALIATQGFRDTIEIADESRFDQYDVLIEKPRPLVPRHLRFTVPERVDVTGRVLLALDEDAVRRVAGQLRIAGVGAVAVAFMHAYAHGGHEHRVAELLAEALPGVYVSISSEVAGEVREYERTSTTVANAYVQPLMASYLARLNEAFHALGSHAPIHLMTSGGSLAALDTAIRFPVRLVESGPAGGAILAAHIAAERGERGILSFDMGGTTAKICLIENGTPLKGRTFEVDRSSRFMKGSGLPVRIPVIEMVEIGAGGGSIARVDAMGRIHVGPESAGSEPGPACYGRGGTRATVTDADLALGRIDPLNFAGGSIELDAAAAERALAAGIGGALGLDAIGSAYGLSEIVDENMANAARVHAVEQGIDVAGRTLVAFGGAAPLHACRLAEKLGIRRVVVPADAGVGSAVGFLMAPAAYEIVRSRHMMLDAYEPVLAAAFVASLAAEAHALAERAAQGRPLSTRVQAFMRYAGQGHEIAVAIDEAMLKDAKAADLMRAAFEREYMRLYARHIPGGRVEIMSFSVLATTGAAPPPALVPLTASSMREAEPVGRRSVYDVAARAFRDVVVYDRRRLAPGDRLAGPAVVVEEGTATVVASGFDAALDAGGALVLTAKEDRP
ncbi:MAG: hydantoinase/oxoprolinase family protein [Hyphomicrobiaceae bacterium]